VFIFYLLLENNLVCSLICSHLDLSIDILLLVVDTN